MGEKIKKGRKRCDREKTNHLQRGGGRDQLYGVSERGKKK